MSTQSASKINWVEVGQPEAETTIIFLHEGLGCVEMWRDYPALLCQKLGVSGIVYDRSGYGKSAGSLKNRKADYLHLAAEELHSLIQSIDIKQPILYGHSDGGSIALIYAAIYGQVIALITEAAHVFNEPETIAGVKAARPLISEGTMDGLKKYHGERYEEVFYAWNDIWLDDSFKNWDITGLLPKIIAPQLIIQGEDDPYGTFKQVDAISEQTKGETRLFLPKNCGHAPFKEQTEQVLNEVVNFSHDIR